MYEEMRDGIAYDMLGVPAVAQLLRGKDRKCVIA